MSPQKQIWSVWAVVTALLSVGAGTSNRHHEELGLALGCVSVFFLFLLFISDDDDDHELDDRDHRE